jgi:hypothetical protein
MNKYNALRKSRRNIQIAYVSASVAWIFLCLCLRVTKSRSYVSYIILTFPVFVYAMGFISSRQINSNNDRNILTTDFVAIALLIITLLLEMYHHNSDHYTINIIISAFILLMFSLIDIPVSRHNVLLMKHLRNITRIAAISLLTYVIFVNVTNKVPMKFTNYHTLN